MITLFSNPTNHHKSPCLKPVSLPFSLIRPTRKNKGEQNVVEVRSSAVAHSSQQDVPMTLNNL